MCTSALRLSTRQPPAAHSQMGRKIAAQQHMPPFLHPTQLAIGMSIFFALGATGGIISLVTQGKPIFESPHVWTGLGGLFCLGLQVGTGLLDL